MPAGQLSALGASAVLGGVVSIERGVFPSAKGGNVGCGELKTVGNGGIYAGHFCHAQFGVAELGIITTLLNTTTSRADMMQLSAVKTTDPRRKSGVPYPHMPSHGDHSLERPHLGP